MSGTAVPIGNRDQQPTANQAPIGASSYSHHSRSARSAKDFGRRLFGPHKRHAAESLPGCQWSPCTEPPRVAQPEPAGSPNLSHFDRVPGPLHFTPASAIPLGNPSFPEGLRDGWTEVRGDGCAGNAPAAPARRVGTPDRPDLGLSRNTVASYRRWATTHNLLTGELPAAATLAALLRPPDPATAAARAVLCGAYQDRVLALRQQGVKGQAIFQLLVEQHGFAGSCSAVKRFVRRLEPKLPRATGRDKAGDEGNVGDGTGRRRGQWTSRNSILPKIFRPKNLAFSWLGSPRRNTRASRPRREEGRGA